LARLGEGRSAENHPAATGQQILPNKPDIKAAIDGGENVSLMAPRAAARRFPGKACIPVDAGIIRGPHGSGRVKAALGSARRNSHLP
jgi:hypothetical protein